MARSFIMIDVYSTENEINLYLYNTYGVKSGDLAGSSDWISYELYSKSQETGLSFSDTDTVITVADGTAYEAGMYLQSGSEVLFVKSISLNDLTVIRGFKGTTAAAGTTLDILTAEEKVDSTIKATDDINQYHGQTYTDYLYLEDELQEVSILHALDISRLRCAYLQAEYIGTVSSRDYNDGVLSVGSAGSRKMSKQVKNRLKQVLSENGHDVGIILRR